MSSTLLINDAKSIPTTNQSNQNFKNGIQHVIWATNTKIEENQFKNWEDLKYVQITGSIYSIGSGAFSGCTGLKQVDLPEGLTKIENSFEGCDKLPYLILPDTVTTFSSLKYVPYFHKTLLPEDIRSAFYQHVIESNPNHLDVIVIPPGVTGVDIKKFQEFMNIEENQTLLNQSGITLLPKVVLPSTFAFAENQYDDLQTIFNQISGNHTIEYYQGPFGVTVTEDT